MVKTIIISICTSLVVSLITFILGLKAGKNQADRDKLQTIYKKMYSHFQDILKGMNEGRHREWSDYKEKKSLYKTEYYPLVKELKSNGELLFIDKNIAEKAEKLERDCLNFAYSVNQTISDIHNVIALNPEYYVGGIKFPNHVKNDSKSHICTVNKDNCNRYRYQIYCSFFSKIELTEILHEWKATTDSYVIDFNTRGNPARFSFRLNPEDLSVDIDAYIDSICALFTETIDQYKDIEDKANELRNRINSLTDTLSYKVKEPTSFRETLFGAFADIVKK